MAKVLVIEDNDMLNRAYRMILEKHEHSVETAFNGQEGLEKAAEFGPNIILLDLLMPVKNGIEFLREYDTEAKGAAKVVILTNLGKDKEVQEAMSLGADRYILKAQSTPQELATLVNHLVTKNYNKVK